VSRKNKDVSAEVSPEDNCQFSCTYWRVADTLSKYLLAELSYILWELGKSCPVIKARTPAATTHFLLSLQSQSDPDNLIHIRERNLKASARTSLILLLGPFLSISISINTIQFN
jgi:hypothetical protein